MSNQVHINPVYPHSAKYYPVIAVDKQGGIIGEVYVYIIGTKRQGRSYAYIDDLKVVEEAQGQGVGRRLMEYAHEIAKRESCYKVVANSHRKREAARALYVSMGYRAHGREFRLDMDTQSQEK